MKLIGIIMTAGGFSYIGFIKSRKLRMRIRALSAAISALEIMENEISYSKKTVPEILCLLSNEAEDIIRPIFESVLNCIDRSDEYTFSEKWKVCVKDIAPHCFLSKDDIYILLKLSTIIGRYDSEEQVKSISLIVRMLSENMRCAEGEYASKSRIYRALSIAAGLAAVIVAV